MKEAYNAAYLFLKYRRFSNLFSRALKIFKRYGLTSKRLENRISEYIDLMQKYNCTSSFPITAQVLNRHPQLIEKYLTTGIEFAIHGCRHLDYTQLLYQTKINDFEKAIDIFEHRNVPFSGFRCPYLKWDDELLTILSDSSFCWDSSQTIIWDCIKREDFNKEKWKNYEKILAQYKPYHAQLCCVRPRLKNNLVEIPVSLPDDDILIDRLGIKNQATITTIWNKILEQTYKQGDLFTLQLHPERIHLCKKALESILTRAAEFDPPIWIASLTEIANWWREKRDFDVEIIVQQKNKYQIKTRCSDRATILVKNDRANHFQKDFFDGYKIINNNVFLIESPTKPVVGISENCSMALFDFLKEEGILFEISDNKYKYGIYLENFVNFTEHNGNEVLDVIDRSATPLVRFWRWPARAKSALSITGDIDALTSIDYLMRLFGR